MKHKIPLNLTDQLEIFYGDEIVMAKIATRDRMFQGEIEVELDSGRKHFIKTIDVISVNGKDLDFADIAEINGISRGLYRQRVDYGWSKERASTQAVDHFKGVRSTK